MLNQIASVVYKLVWAAIYAAKLH